MSINWTNQCQHGAAGPVRKIKIKTLCLCYLDFRPSNCKAGMMKKKWLFKTVVYFETNNWPMASLDNPTMLSVLFFILLCLQTLPEKPNTSSEVVFFLWFFKQMLIWKAQKSMFEHSHPVDQLFPLYNVDSRFACVMHFYSNSTPWLLTFGSVSYNSP